ncbi:hypothetical protein B0O44_11256 [Pedobacter nutrimenti]|uniref:Uncharacterized protein n=1 Tax=Pedobacter nutrimenti TaxID=1241337 RepID=A0A318U8X4_9SPHI|nr:hypothetical protein B0O44_11256 [Pedobacter nutrimenti]
MFYIILFYFVHLNVKNSKSHIENKKQGNTVVNPFIKMIEDKKRISEAIKEGKTLSSLKEIAFVKPL